MFYLTNPAGNFFGMTMLGVDFFARFLEPFVPKFFQNKGIKKAMEFVTERLNGEDGLGGIFPAMANALMAFDAIDYPSDHPDYVVCRKD